MKVEVELPELPEGYEYTGKMIPDKGDEYIDGDVDKNRFPHIYRWGTVETPAFLHPVVRKKQLTFNDLRVDEYFRYADERIARQKSILNFPEDWPRPVVRIKWEDVK